TSARSSKSAHVVRSSRIRNIPIPGSCSLRSQSRTPHDGGGKGSYHRRRSRARSARWATSLSSRRSEKSDRGISWQRIASPDRIDRALDHPKAQHFGGIAMKTSFRALLLVAAAFGAAIPYPASAAKDVVFAVASTFTTTDPYDANDTLSQAMAKSFYEGLF